MFVGMRRRPTTTLGVVSDVSCANTGTGLRPDIDNGVSGCADVGAVVVVCVVVVVAVVVTAAAVVVVVVVMAVVLAVVVVVGMGVGVGVVLV